MHRLNRLGGLSRHASMRARAMSSVSLRDSIDKLQPGLAALRQAMDAHVIGHDDIKHAALLGLLSREHVYLEGPPGVAKTMLAEVIVQSAGLHSWFYQMHRDTRLSELIGDSVIVREPVHGTSSDAAEGEIIRHEYKPGGILTCELCVLDDISRAPGEALNVLLRILNERKFGGQNGDGLPLLSAIATGNPAEEDGYYAEPLDPATLDRFALQLQATGLVDAGEWEQARLVIDMYGQAGDEAPSEALSESPALQPNLLHDASTLVPRVLLGSDVAHCLVRLLQVLKEEYDCSGETALLTDRTFLVKAVSVLKAQAVLNGRAQCERDDLRVLRFMSTFRVPQQVHEQMPQIIDAVLAEPSPPASDGDTSIGPDATGIHGDGDGANDGTGSQDNSEGERSDGSSGHGGSSDSNESSGGGGDGGAGQGTGGGSDSASDGSDHNPNKQADSGTPGAGDHAHGCTGSTQLAEEDAPRQNAAQRAENAKAALERMRSQSALQAQCDVQAKAEMDAREARLAHGSTHEVELGHSSDNTDNDERDAPGSAQRALMRDQAAICDMSSVFQQLQGHLERGKVSPSAHPGGLPRGWKAGRFDSPDLLADADACETYLWCQQPSPQLPRVQRRVRDGVAGRVAVLRDTSTSMTGLWNEWASLLCAGVVEMARRQRMRVGYLEFNSKATKFVDRRKAFFTREYEHLCKHVHRVTCDGLTNYERPISMALAEFLKQQPQRKTNIARLLRQKRTDQHILFITDGQPTSGDRLLSAELTVAESLGIAIHTVYIGHNRCPAVLDRLSETTGGSRFRAYFDFKSKGVQLVDRASPDQPWKLQGQEDPQMELLAKVPALFSRSQMEIADDTTYMW